MLNEKKFKEIYDQYRESGLTVRDFCLNQRIGEAKFYYWQNKLRHNNNRSASGEFVPMVAYSGASPFSIPEVHSAPKSGKLAPF